MKKRWLLPLLLAAAWSSVAANCAKDADGDARVSANMPTVEVDSSGTVTDLEFDDSVPAAEE